MSFPQVLGVNRRLFPQSTSPQIVPLPWHIESGDLLLIVFCGRTNTTLTTPSGWTSLLQVTPSNSVRLAVFYRIADGSETDGSTVSVAQAVGANCCAFALRIGGNGGNPEAAGASSTASSTPDPPNLAPSWGTEDTLWIAAYVGNTNDGCSAQPSGYANFQEERLTTSLRTQNPSESSGGAPEINLCGGIIRKEERVASDDPSAFSLSASQAWAAVTIAVRGSVTPHERVSVIWAD